MNKEVTFPIATLLKEKNFPYYCKSGYTEKGVVYLHQGGQELVRNGEEYYEGRNYEGDDFYCSAPTIADVVMWLYEKYDIWISVEPPFPRRNVLWEYYIQSAEDRSLMHQNSGYDSPTEAYEAAIEYVLNNLI